MTYRGSMTLRDPRTMCEFVAKTASALQVPVKTYKKAMSKKNPIKLQFTNATTVQSDDSVVKVLKESLIDVDRNVEFISYLHQTEDLVAKQLKEVSKSTPPEVINPKELSEKDCIIICRSSVKRWSRSKLCEEEIWVYPRDIELLQKSIEEDGYGAPKLNAKGKFEDQVWDPLNFQIPNHCNIDDLVNVEQRSFFESRKEVNVPATLRDQVSMAQFGRSEFSLEEQKYRSVDSSPFADYKVVANENFSKFLEELLNVASSNPSTEDGRLAHQFLKAKNTTDFTVARHLKFAYKPSNAATAHKLENQLDDIVKEKEAVLALLDESESDTISQAIQSRKKRPDTQEEEITSDLREKKTLDDEIIRLQYFQTLLFGNETRQDVVAYFQGKYVEIEDILNTIPPRNMTWKEVIFMCRASQEAITFTYVPAKRQYVPSTCREKLWVYPKNEIGKFVKEASKKIEETEESATRDVWIPIPPEQMGPKDTASKRRLLYAINCQCQDQNELQKRARLDAKIRKRCRKMLDRQSSTLFTETVVRGSDDFEEKVKRERANDGIRSLFVNKYLWVKETTYKKSMHKEIEDLNVERSAALYALMQSKWQSAGGEDNPDTIFEMTDSNFTGAGISSNFQWRHDHAVFPSDYYSYVKTVGGYNGSLFRMQEVTVKYQEDKVAGTRIFEHMLRHKVRFGEDDTNIGRIFRFHNFAHRLMEYEHMAFDSIQAFIQTINFARQRFTNFCAIIGMDDKPTLNLADLNFETIEESIETQIATLQEERQKKASWYYRQRQTVKEKQLIAQQTELESYKISNNTITDIFNLKLQEYIDAQQKFSAEAMGNPDEPMKETEKMKQYMSKTARGLSFKESCYGPTGLKKIETDFATYKKRAVHLYELSRYYLSYIKKNGSLFDVLPIANGAIWNCQEYVSNDIMMVPYGPNSTLRRQVEAARQQIYNILTGSKTETDRLVKCEALTLSFFESIDLHFGMEINTKDLFVREALESSKFPKSRTKFWNDYDTYFGHFTETVDSASLGEILTKALNKLEGMIATKTKNNDSKQRVAKKEDTKFENIPIKLTAAEKKKFLTFMCKPIVFSEKVIGKALNFRKDSDFAVVSCKTENDMGFKIPLKHFQNMASQTNAIMGENNSNISLENIDGDAGNDFTCVSASYELGGKVVFSGTSNASEDNSSNLGQKWEQTSWYGGLYCKENQGEISDADMAILREKLGENTIFSSIPIGTKEEEIEIKETTIVKVGNKCYKPVQTDPNMIIKELTNIPRIPDDDKEDDEFPKSTIPIPQSSTFRSFLTNMGVTYEYEFNFLDALSNLIWNTCTASTNWSGYVRTDNPITERESKVVIICSETMDIWNPKERCDGYLWLFHKGKMKDITEKGIKYIDAQVEECVQNIQLPIPGYWNYKEPIPDRYKKDKKGRIKIRNKREIIQALLVAIEADFGRKSLEEQSQDPLQTFCLSMFQKFMTDSGFGLNNASSKIKSAYTRFVPESVRRVGFKLSRAMMWSIKFIYNNPYVVMILSLLVKVIRIVACLYTQGVNWKQIKAFAYALCERLFSGMLIAKNLMRTFIDIGFCIASQWANILSGNLMGAIDSAMTQCAECIKGILGNMLDIVTRLFQWFATKIDLTGGKFNKFILDNLGQEGDAIFWVLKEFQKQFDQPIHMMINNIVVRFIVKRPMLIMNMIATFTTAMPVPAIMEEFGRMVVGDKAVNYIGNYYDDLAVKFIKMQEFLAALRNLVDVIYEVYQYIYCWYKMFFRRRMGWETEEEEKKMLTQYDNCKDSKCQDAKNLQIAFFDSYDKQNNTDKDGYTTMSEKTKERKRQFECCKETAIIGAILQDQQGYDKAKEETENAQSAYETQCPSDNTYFAAGMRMFPTWSTNESDCDKLRNLITEKKNALVQAGKDTSSGVTLDIADHSYVGGGLTQMATNHKGGWTGYVFGKLAPT